MCRRLKIIEIFIGLKNVGNMERSGEFSTFLSPIKKNVGYFSPTT
jgi:hypothetical protein